MAVRTVTRRAGHGREKRRRLMQSLVAALLVPAGAAAAQDDARPSAVEHALVEYLCRSIQGPTMLGTEEYQSCYSAQLDALRVPFGRNLSNLTAAERKTVDAWCGKIQAARDRDAYLACLNRQLVRLAEQRAAKARSAEVAGEASPVESEPAAPLEAVAAVSAPPPQPEKSSGTLWLILAIGGVASAGGTAFVMMRGKRTSSPTACRGCGAPVDLGGDMCANCRHDAAESRRRAIAERVEEERLQAEKARHEAELLDEEARREQARRDEVLRLAAESEQRRREEQERRLQRAQAEHAGDADAVFDPYAVLGVTPTATADQIRGAYEQAKAKYDASQYEHFGGELQAHFKAKADAVERAFQMLYASE